MAADASAPPVFHVQLSFGPMLIGVFLNMILYGVLLNQMYFYFQTYKTEVLWIRLLVIYLFIVETANTVLDMAMMYQPLITEYGTTKAVQNFPTPNKNAPPHSYLAFDNNRTHHDRRHFNSYSMLLRLEDLEDYEIALDTIYHRSSLIRIIWQVSFIPVFHIAILKLFAKKPELHWSALLWFLTSCVADLLITGTLVRTLVRLTFSSVYGAQSQRKTGFGATDTMIDKLIRLTVQTGMITAICAIGDVAFFMALPHAALNFIWDLMLSKLYANCLMSTLNARSTLLHGSQNGSSGVFRNGLDGMNSREGRRQTDVRLDHSMMTAPQVYELDNTKTFETTHSGTPLDYRGDGGYGITVTKLLEIFRLWRRWTINITVTLKWSLTLEWSKKFKEHTWDFVVELYLCRSFIIHSDPITPSPSPLLLELPLYPFTSSPLTVMEKSEDIESGKASSVGSSSDLRMVEDPAMEKRVWRKIDFYVLPIVAMFYLLSFLDRTNVANARVAGLQTALKMTNKQYSIALTVTYVPYIAAELPSNLLLKAVGPNLMLPTMLTIWGIVTTLQGVVKTYGGLLACRFFIGLFEGGLFPGLVLYLSYFYPRHKMNLRVSTFFSSASVSGAFSGILAFAIIKMNGVGGLKGTIGYSFCLFTVVFGVSAYFTLPRSVDKCWFFTQEEKNYVNARLLEDEVHDEEGFSWKEVIEATKLPQVWFLAIAYFLDGAVLYGLAYFSPSIIQGLGYTAARAQLMSVPPFAAAFALAMICAYISDRYRCRGIIMIASSILCVIGFAMFLGSKSHRVQYGSLFLSIGGTYVTAPTLSAWGSNNAAPQTRRATAIAIGFIMTNSGGILATWLLGSLSPAPRYTKATVTLLIFSVLMALFGGFNLFYLWSQNKKKAEMRKTMTRDQEDPSVGNHSAWYIYNL
ncbi:hypothetical protein D9757_011276 [Collybiopsis confluens]|uniref:Major facilitator superfamily (MFS) profile domain-containing protein n=1 Tax=Collybiopsis confluens TaxID=2823264 RepID=A0A8H5GHH9_9AGAR|nr:hypothetical protein D9757_011276 [Collybiopsis confluens]